MKIFSELQSNSRNNSVCDAALVCDETVCFCYVFVMLLWLLSLCSLFFSSCLWCPDHYSRFTHARTLSYPHPKPGPEPCMDGWSKPDLASCSFSAIMNPTCSWVNVIVSINKHLQMCAFVMVCNLHSQKKKEFHMAELLQKVTSASVNECFHTICTWPVQTSTPHLLHLFKKWKIWGTWWIKWVLCLCCTFQQVNTAHKIQKGVITFTSKNLQYY